MLAVQMIRIRFTLLNLRCAGFAVNWLQVSMRRRDASISGVN
jgi:hypothetical protein